MKNSSVFKAALRSTSVLGVLSLGIATALAPGMAAAYCCGSELVKCEQNVALDCAMDYPDMGSDYQACVTAGDDQCIALLGPGAGGGGGCDPTVQECLRAGAITHFRSGAELRQAVAVAFALPPRS